MKPLLRAALLLAILPLSLRAQVTLRGSVVDQATSAPIPGATIRVKGSTLTATTTDSGTFNLRSARAITGVTVSRLGYAQREVTVSDASSSLRIELTASTTELPGVEVVAHNPAPSTALLTRSDLERFSGIDLMSTINTVPGVFMQSRTPFGGAHITIRGYYPSFGGNSPNSNNSGTNVFLNDVPITDASGITLLDDVDFSSLGSVRIIKGAASSMFGSAIGGTVNLGFERPTIGKTSFRQQVLSGGNGLLRTNTGFQGANGTSDFAINYGHQADNSFRPHSESQKEYLRANGDVAVGTNQAVSAFFTYNRSSEELAGEIDTTEFYNRIPQSNPVYLANDSHTNVMSFLTGVTDNYRISDRFTNQTIVFGNGRFSNGPFAHGFTDNTQFSWGARSMLGYTGQVAGVDLNGSFGAQIQRTLVTSNGVFITPAPPYPERPSASENSAVNSYLFTEWNVSLPAEVTVTVGGSLIYNTFTVHNMLKSGALFDTTTSLKRKFGAVFAPRAEVQKSFGRLGSLYASASTGYTPALLSNVAASDGTVNADLKPERAMQYEVGAQGAWLQNRLNGQVALFQIDNRDKLVSQTISGVTETINVGEQKNSGAEASLNYLVMADPNAMVSLLRPWVSYSYMKAQFVDFKSNANNNGTAIDFSDNRVPRVPQNMMSAGIDANTRIGAYITSTYQFVGAVPVTFDNSTWVRSYNTLSAKLGYKKLLMKRYSLDVAVGGDNLTGSTWYQFLFVGPNIAGLATPAGGGTGDGYILPGFYKARYYGSLNVSVPLW